MEREISVMTSGHNRFSKAAQRKQLNFAKTKMESYVIYELFKGTWEVSQSIQIQWDIFLISQHWKKYLYQRGRSWDCQSVLEYGLIPGGKEKDKARQAVFLTPTNLFGNDPEEERAHDDLTVPYITSWNAATRCTTIRSGGLWIGILADEVVCNHDLRNNTWRLHWSRGIRWWRSSTFTNDLKLQGHRAR